MNLSSILNKVHVDNDYSREKVNDLLQKSKIINQKFNKHSFISFYAKKEQQNPNFLHNTQNISSVNDCGELLTDFEIVRRKTRLKTQTFCRRLNDPIFTTGHQLQKQKSLKLQLKKNVPRSSVETQFKKFSHLSQQLLSDKKFTEEIQANYFTKENLKDNQTSSNTPSMQYQRKKNYSVTYIENWYSKMRIPFKKIEPDIASRQEFQRKVILDELKVLLDNLQRYKHTCLSNRKIVTVFKALEKKNQVKLNTLLEETTGLMHSIGYGILFDFKDYFDKFVTIPLPEASILMNSTVTSEEAEFIKNAKIFNEVSTFLQASFEVYQIISQKLDDLIFPVLSFYKIQQYFARCRLNISNLLFSTLNYYKNYLHDKTLVMKYSREMTALDEQGNNKNILFPVSPFYAYQISSKSLSEKINDNFTFKVSEEKERKKRLNAILTMSSSEDKCNSNEKRKKRVAQNLKRPIIIEAKIIDQVLPYCSKEDRTKILAERLVKRFREKGQTNNLNI